MESELNVINKMIKEYVQDCGKVDEKVFNIGVALGRLLERNNFDNHRLSFFSEQEQKNNDIQIRFKRLLSVHKIIEKIIVLAHVEQVRKTRQINYINGGHSKNNPLSSELEEKYNITYKGIDVEDGNQDFDITFELNGKLKEIFQKHNVGAKFVINLCNSSGENSELINSVHKAETSFYGTTMYSIPTIEELTVEQAETFAVDVEKFYTMFCLKLN